MFHTYNCLLVDDEQAAHFVLQHYIDRVCYLKVAGACYSTMEAIRFLQQHTVDILFLDMEMPEISGLEILKSIPNLPKTILTTAYTDYALVGYDYGIVDYLLKPFEFSRFLKAINRATDKGFSPDQLTDQRLAIKVDGEMIHVPVEDISYIQSLGNYVRIFTTKEQSYLTLTTLAKIEDTLSKTAFIRIHKSYIVNIQLLTAVDEKEVQLASAIPIPIGITYKRKLMDLWSQTYGKNT